MDTQPEEDDVDLPIVRQPLAHPTVHRLDEPPLRLRAADEVRVMPIRLGEIDAMPQSGGTAGVG